MRINKSKQSALGRPASCRKVYVAMSGGVDSSVAAVLLAKATPKNFKEFFDRPTPKGFRGYDVTGVYFKPWSDSADVEYCNWKEDRQDAMRVAAKLGIKFKTWDFSCEYGKLVTKYMIDSYRAGITPNPDVMCNKEIKFGLFLKKALAEGAQMIATGHYARVKKSGKSYKLLKGIDTNKDQSYFLYNLTQKELKHCLFPIGGHTKPEVRKLAKQFGLPNHAKHDSQGVCFVGQLDMKEFLEKYIKPKAGDVKLVGPSAGGKQIIGRHDGVYYYTIGQRHGLNLGIAGGPYFIVKKDLKKNIIYVSDQLSQAQLDSKSLSVHQVNWVNGTKLPTRAEVKIRYRSTSIPAVLSKSTSGKLTVKFQKPARVVTSGQSAVFYRGQEVLGGGIIV